MLRLKGIIFVLLALLFVAGIAQAAAPPTMPVIFTDPEGDSPMADIISVEGYSDSTMVNIRVNFSALTDMMSVDGYVCLDTDQNPMTGNADYMFAANNVGCEYFIHFLTGAGGMYQVEDPTHNPVFTSMPSISGQSIEMWVPLSVVMDDGKMNIAVALDSAAIPYEWAPNSGYGMLENVPPGGEVPDSWTIYSVEPSGLHWIDWAGYYHEPLAIGSYVMLGGTFYYVADSAVGSWSGPAGYFSAALQQCDQVTGTPMTDPTGSPVYAVLDPSMAGQTIFLFSSIPAWVVYSVEPTMLNAVDWPVYVHGPITTGMTYMKIGDTYYYVYYAGSGASWSGIGFNWAQLVTCNQITGEADVFPGAPYADLSGTEGLPIEMYIGWPLTLPEFTITSSQSGSGSVTPTTTVSYNGTVTMYAGASPGYHIEAVKIDGVDEPGPFSSPYSYTFTNVTADHTIEVTFVPDDLTITSTFDSTRGMMTATTTVPYHANKTMYAVANTGYHINSVKIDGVNQAGPFTTTYNYTFWNVTANHTITVTFAPDNVTITTYKRGSGTITASTTVAYDGSATITATPDAGYHVQRVTVDGVLQAGPYGNPYSYTFTNVTRNHSITVTFAPDNVTITTYKSGSGTVTPTTAVAYDGSATITATPDAGYHVQRVTVDGVLQAGPYGNPYSYMFTNVTANHSIAVTFVPDTLTITSYFHSGRGTMTPTTVVPYNGSATFTATPIAGYHIEAVRIDGVTNLPGPFSSPYSYTFTNVTANHSIAVTFVPDNVTITTYKSGSGTITPTTKVAYDGSATITGTAAPGYHVDRVTVDGVLQAGPYGNPYSYTFTNVTRNHSITAIFTQD